MLISWLTSILNARLVLPVRRLLTQGVTPEKIALTLALGMTISICPLLGLPTILCIVAAMAFRLNLGLLQAVNYLGTVPQWALIIPFLRMGEHLCRLPPLPISIPQVRASFETDFWGTTFWFWEAAGVAVLAWLLVAPVLFGALYLGLLPIIRGTSRAMAERRLRKAA